ncbi:hypothetical protein M9H77_13839 [Catharanthus roseus]|uniref:Uncharacterized protein n=1 Tax=Catharanthus roseus TaxID=4058 RepID=A0ACC0BLC0_CATRO|nr:hypothetical protein M9H77_13839 [Catharanthus roseus]
MQRARKIVIQTHLTTVQLSLKFWYKKTDCGYNVNQLPSSSPANFRYVLTTNHVRQQPSKPTEVDQERNSKLNIQLDTGISGTPRNGKAPTGLYRPLATTRGKPRRWRTKPILHCHRRSQRRGDYIRHALSLRVFKFKRAEKKYSRKKYSRIFQQQNFIAAEKNFQQQNFPAAEKKTAAEKYSSYKRRKKP